MEQINTKELSDFLEEANKNTYANKDAAKAKPTRLNSSGYHFEKGDWMYHDTYFGARDFIGNEVVYKSELPVWGMNYYGYMFSAEMEGKKLYAFLREAIMQKYTDIIPVRGPKKYENNEWKYTSQVNGNLERFTGKEEIYFNNELVYEANYHGGFIVGLETNRGQF